MTERAKACPLEKDTSKDRQTDTCICPGVHQRILELLGDPAGLDVLEVGCYQGSLSRSLLRRGAKVSSCDLICHPGADELPDFKTADANSTLPYPSSSFDIVVSTDVIEHLDRPANLVLEAARVLRAGGTLLVSTPNVSGITARLEYLLRGWFPTFSPGHYANWSHVSTLSAPWMLSTAARAALTCEGLWSEAGAWANMSLRRRLLHALCLPAFALAARKQPGCLLAGTTLIARFGKPQ